ncbi:hypothetical protein [Streptomyces alanosinicus]|uniref:hypothetical protein n=1 Tax=Streptomyces alanosinicus TaxID=68171 RepID=UPI0016742F78|nr:hypothetical protein [Streptomyces alanosinicus]
MTTSSTPPAAPDRGPVVALLVTTAFLLLPLVYGLYYLAHDSQECFRPTGCRGGRSDAETLLHGALLLIGLPSVGAVLGGIGGSFLRRRPGVWAATGALLGALAVWAATLAWLQHSWKGATLIY